MLCNPASLRSIRTEPGTSASFSARKHPFRMIRKRLFKTQGLVPAFPPLPGRMAGGRTADAMESSRVLLDVLSRSHTKEDIRKSLESLGKFSVTDEIVADIFFAFQRYGGIPGMVYRDAAGLEDVAAAVVPDTLDEDLKPSLMRRGSRRWSTRPGTMPTGCGH